MNQADNLNDTLVTPNKQPDVDLPSTPMQSFGVKDIASLQAVNLAESMPPPTPMEMTPTQAIGMPLNHQSPVPQNSLNLSADAYTYFYEPAANIINCYNTPIKGNTSEVTVSLTAYTSNAGNSHITTPAYTSIVVNIPTEYTTTTSSMQPTIMAAQVQPQIFDNIDLNALGAQIEAGPVRKQKGGCRHKRYRFKSAKFDEMEAAQIPAKVSFFIGRFLWGIGFVLLAFFTDFDFISLFTQ